MSNIASTSEALIKKPFEPSSFDCAVLFLRLVDLKNEGREKPITRLKISASSLRALWLRPHLRPDFVQEVGDWLLRADWILFYTGKMYAAVSTGVVPNWPRISSNQFDDEELGKVASGKLKPADLTQLRARTKDSEAEGTDVDE